MIITETPRLILRQLSWDDLDDLATLYADPVVMQFFSGTRTHAETTQELAQILDCYEKRGFSLWATIHKPDNQFMGRCGLIPQEVDGLQEVEVGYMLAKPYWGQGLATEAARAIRDYGFCELGCRRLISLIDPENVASQKVAMKNGMTYEKTTTKWEKTMRVYATHMSKRL